MKLSELPVGRSPQPVPMSHFPDSLHAVVWRNWDVVPVEELARVLGARTGQIEELAYSMGLPKQRRIEKGELRRNYMTFLHRNWHLLPYEQISDFLGWTPEQMLFSLNEDDFMYVKLGGYKPQCSPVRYQTPTEETKAGAAQIKLILESELGDRLSSEAEPPFGFVEGFARQSEKRDFPQNPSLEIRMVYPYFLRFGDPLSGEGIEDVPESYLAALAAAGINAVWIQAILNKLAPWELSPELSEGWETRLSNLPRLVERCARFGIKVFIYLNEPRAMPREFFLEHPELRGVEETPERSGYSPDVVALCVSTPAVREFLVNAVKHVFQTVPALGGVLAITYSENLTNCYSREYDSATADNLALRSAVMEGTRTKLKPCARCAERGPEVVNADVCKLIDEGMRLAGSSGELLLYVWSTPEHWVPGIVENLPESTWILCVSEWGTPFARGDYNGRVNEYSISIVGPSDQSKRQWAMAQHKGFRTAAKMQAANTYEISSLPYIPALRLVAEHYSRLARSGVRGLMLGWTAGGSPSPNLDLISEFAKPDCPQVQDALLAVASRRYGESVAHDVVRAWNCLSDAYEEFPFDMSVCYNGPQSLGPANLLFVEPTGFAATMVTFPFDDLEGWRGPYSEDTLQAQFEKLAVKWEDGVRILKPLGEHDPTAPVNEEWRIAEAARLHFQSTANQIRFIRARGTNRDEARQILKDEIGLASRLYDLVAADSRIGFEATNHYGYIRLDLAEKIVSCNEILRRWDGDSHGGD